MKVVPHIKNGFGMGSITDNIRIELQQNIDAKTSESTQHFFKEKVKFYGVRTPTVNKISRAYFALIESKTKSEILGLCENLWQSGFIEESIIACRWSYFIRQSYEPSDFRVFEKWVNIYVNNWASCDTLCNHSIGKHIEMYPEFVARLKTFAQSNNRWMRRAASVSLIVPARKGKFLNEILEIADVLLLDKDDLVQKGYGWLLKTAGEANQQKIFDYVMENKDTMPRTALRYAIEKMPKEWKNKAMGKSF